MDIKNVFEKNGNPLSGFANLGKTAKTECEGIETKKKFEDDAQLGSVRGINVRAGYIVDGIEVIYEDGTGEFRGNKAGGKEYCCMLEEDDEIHSIEGDYGVPFGGAGAISSLIIRTKKGKTFGPFGSGRSGKEFRIILPTEAHFIGFFGNVDNTERFLTKIGMVYLK